MLHSLLMHRGQCRPPVKPHAYRESKASTICSTDLPPPREIFLSRLLPRRIHNIPYLLLRISMVRDVVMLHMHHGMVQDAAFTQRLMTMALQPQAGDDKQ